MQFKNKLRLRLKKVKMFLVETLLNLVIYVSNVHSKNTAACGRGLRKRTKCTVVSNLR